MKRFGWRRWTGLSALAVEWLGMPVGVMAFYSSSALIKWKAGRILAFVLETGNFGHNRDVSYMKRYPYVIRKAISLWRHTWDYLRWLLIILLVFLALAFILLLILG